MNQPTVPIPSELAATLARYRGEVVLTGPDGRPAGHVLSPEQYRAMRDAANRGLMTPPTEEQIRASLARGGEHSMDEVIKMVEDA